MTLRNMPRMEMGARPGVNSHISLGALNRWNSDLRASGEDDASISILDPIGSDGWGEGVSAKRIGAALRSIGERPVSVNLNSPGGDVFEGIAIYNQLQEHKAKVTVNVLGLAASAASVIAMAGDEIRIGRAAFLMIHNTWVVAMGDRHAFRDVADWLEPFDQALIDVYATRSGIASAELGAMMDKETWLSGSKAIELGMADELLGSENVSIDANENARNMRAERKFDLVAARAGLARGDARALLKELKGGMPGAAQPGKPGAADIGEEVKNLLKSINELKGS